MQPPYSDNTASTQSNEIPFRDNDNAYDKHRNTARDISNCSFCEVRVMELITTIEETLMLPTMLSKIRGGPTLLSQL
jgi:hypothetical protein